ncbi:30S ribosomal protein S6 [bacterium]|jgi:small subunit ribosomal protein S6|nr:30S ribosomal protein S6 [bacterium]
MRKYETIIIFDSVLTDEQVAAESENFNKFLSENGAKDIVLDGWGKRELAYQMNKKNYGAYTVFYYEADSAELGERINDLLRINESVTKFQTHRISDSTRKFKGRLSGEHLKKSAA